MRCVRSSRSDVIRSGEFHAPLFLTDSNTRTIDTRYSPPPMKVRPMRIPIRHGEILLVPISSAPKGVVTTVSECIVGHSETGHHHVLESETVFAQIVVANGDLFVDLDAPTPLRHRKAYQQHRELTVPPGVWRVIRKTEFDVREMRERPEAVVPQRIPELREDVVRSVARPEPPPVRWVRD